MPSLVNAGLLLSWPSDSSTIFILFPDFLILNLFISFLVLFSFFCYEQLTGSTEKRYISSTDTAKQHHGVDGAGDDRHNTGVTDKCLHGCDL